MLLISAQSCFFKADEIKTIGLDKDKIKNGGQAAKTISLSNVDVLNDQLVINGTNLDSATSIRVTGPSGFDETFAIESKSSSQIIANSLSNLTVLVNGVFSLIVSNAQGAATYTITFQLQDGQVTAAKLNDMGAVAGEVLTYDGATWGPAPLSGLSYKGTFNATGGDQTTVTEAAGHYYIVTTAGSNDPDGINNGNTYSVGDWAVYNGTTSSWDRVVGSNAVVSVAGKVGAVTLDWGDFTKTGSVLDDIANVDVSGRADGDILVWNNTTSKWEVGQRTTDTNTNAATLCGAGQYLDGDGNCYAIPTDTNTTYTAGSGLDLTGTTFSVPAQGITNTMISGIAANCSSGELLEADGTGGFTCIPAPVGTTYSAGAGLGLSGTTFNVDVGTGANQIVQLDGSGNLPGLNGSNLTNVTAASVAVQDITSSLTNYFGYQPNGTSCSNGEILEWNGAQGWICGTKTIDNDTTYTAGTGLNLSGTTFSIAAQGVTNSMINGIAANCSSGEVLKADGSGGFNCAADAGAGGSDANQLMGEDLDPSLATNTTTNGQILVWSESNSRWEVGAAPTDNDTTYTAGTGLTLTGTTFDVDIDTTTTLGTSDTVVPSQNAVKTYVDAEVGGINESQWITSGLDIYYNTGNVGIGTTTPATPLDVNGAIYVRGNINRSGDTRINFVDGNIGLIVNSRNGITAGKSGNLQVNIGDTLESATGIVSIKNNTEILNNVTVKGSDVSNTMSIVNESSTAARIPSFKVQNFTGGNGGYPAIDLTNARGSSAVPAATNAADPAGLFQFWGHDGTSAQRIGSIGAYTEAGTTGASAPGFLQFNTTPSGSTVPSEKMRITAAGRMGIGTTNPAVELDVNTGTINAAAICDENNANCLDLSAGVGGSSPWTTTGSDLYYNTGDVGIGNTAPGAGLHLTRKVGSSQSAIIEGDTSLTGAPKITFRDSNGGATDADLSFDQASGFSFTGTGVKLGVGTSSPAFTIHSIAGIGNDRYTDGAPGAHYFMRKARGTEASPTIVTNGDEISTLWGQGYDGNSFETAARIKFLIDGVPGDGDMPGRIDFTTTPDGSTVEQTRMVIRESGRIGIGTVAPDVELDVNTGTINAAAICDENNANCLDLSAGVGGSDNLGNHTATQNLILGAHYISGDGGNEGLLVDGTGNVTASGTVSLGFDQPLRWGASYIIAHGGDNNMRFHTNGAEQMRINGTNVGVGVTSPNEKLTVNGSISMAEGTAPTNTAGFGKIYVNSADSKLYFMNDTGTTFDLTADIDTTLTLDTTSTLGTSDLVVPSQNAVKTYVDNATGAITSSQWITTGNDIYYNTGSIGMGTSSPTGYETGTGSRYLVLESSNGSAEMVIRHTGNSLGHAPALSFASDANRIAYIRTQKTNTGLHDGHLQFGTSDGTTLSEKMRIESTGSVGIGATTVDASAKVQIDSTTKGFLPPRMTEAQRDAIATPADGLVVYNTTSNKLNIYESSSWQEVGSGGTVNNLPGFRATLSANQAIGVGTYKVNLNNELFDNNGEFDNTTNYRFTVTKAGFYAFSGWANMSSLTDPAAVTSIYIYKNGVGIISENEVAQSGYTSVTRSIAVIDKANVGDYYELYVSSNDTSGSNNITAGASFSGAYIGALTYGAGSGGALTTDSVTSNEIADNAVTSSEISDGTITGTDIGSNTVSVSNLDFASTNGINIPSLASDPAGGTAGQTYFNTTTNKMMYYDGTAWRQLDNGATTSALINGAPDAITCTNSLGKPWVFLLGGQSDSDNDFLYYPSWDTTATYRLRVDDSTLLISDEPNLTTGCSIGTSISTLISTGQAKYFGNDIATVNSDDDADTKIMTEKNADEDKIRFDTAGAERMIITETGNVGIGLSDPTEQLATEGDGVQSTMGMNTYREASSGSKFVFRQSRGSRSAKTASQAGDYSNISFRAYDGSAFGDAAEIRGGSDATATAGSTPGRLRFYTTPNASTTSVERMQIDSDGNVGIGTTNPTEKLQVNGNDENVTLKITNENSTSALYPGIKLYNYTGGTTGHNWIGQYSSGGNNVTPAAVPANQNVGGFGFYAYDGTAFKDVARIMAGTGPNFTTGDQEGEITFLTGDGTTYTERMVINNEGNVGINVATPNSTLHVAKNNATRTLAYFDDNQAANNNSDVVIEAFRPGLVLRDETTAATDFRMGLDGGNVIFSVDSNNDESKNANSHYDDREPVLLINDAGRVGVNTGTIAEPFKVEAGADDLISRFQSTTGEDVVKGIRVNARNVGGTTRYVDFVVDPVNNQLGLDIGASSAGLAMGNADLSKAEFVIDGATGRIGVGTTNPIEMLHLNSATGAEGTNGIFIQDPTAAAPFGGKIYYDDAGGTEGMKFASSTSGGETGYLFIERDSGEVGINITTPISTFHVNDGPTMTGGWRRVATFSALHPAIQLKGSSQENSSAWIELDDATSTAGMSFRVAGTTDDIATATRAMTIRNSGNVGIGTVAPSYKLHVNGTAYATGAAGSLSDRRHKKNISPIENYFRKEEVSALDIIMGLKPVTFDWIDPLDSGMEGIQLGFIAQEVEEVLPEAVLIQKDEDQTRALTFNTFIPVIVKALQDQQKEIEENMKMFKAMQGIYEDVQENKRAIASLEEKVDVLEEENRELKEKNAKLEERLKKIEAMLGL